MRLNDNNASADVQFALKEEPLATSIGQALIKDGYEEDVYLEPEVSDQVTMQVLTRVENGYLANFDQYNNLSLTPPTLLQNQPFNAEEPIPLINQPICDTPSTPPIGSNENFQVEDERVYHELQPGKWYPPVEQTTESPTDIPIIVTPEEYFCRGCAEPIVDSCMLKVNDLWWHESCLKCCECDIQLGQQYKCYVKDNDIFCEDHFVKAHGIQCAKCCRLVAPSDWVRRAGGHVFHDTCFTCATCDRLLSTGEQFCLRGSRLECRTHAKRKRTRTAVADEQTDSPATRRRNAKRMRTAFTDDQLELLQEEYKENTNPVGAELDRIATEVGLNKRVVQVWFQNARARSKKGN